MSTQSGSNHNEIKFLLFTTFDLKRYFCSPDLTFLVRERVLGSTETLLGRF